MIECDMRMEYKISEKQEIQLEKLEMEQMFLDIFLP